MLEGYVDKMLNLLKSALSLCYDRTPVNHDLDICIAKCKIRGRIRISGEATLIAVSEIAAAL